MKSLIAALLLMVSVSVHADHNSHVQGHDSNRGYNKENCNARVSTLGIPGVWLGHKAGCMLDEGNHYALIGEYRFLFFLPEDGKKVVEFIKANPGAEIIMEDEEEYEPKGIPM